MEGKQFEGIIRWCKAHGFKTKILNDTTILWQTNYQTAEWHVADDIADNWVVWHEQEYFDKVGE